VQNSRINMPGVFLFKYKTPFHFTARTQSSAKFFCALWSMLQMSREQEEMPVFTDSA